MARKRSYPASVKPGIPRLGKLPDGWSRVTFGDVLRIVERPVILRDSREYQLITAKRNRGGIIPRERLLGEHIKTKNHFSVCAGDFLISNRQIVHGACGIVPPELDGAVVSNEYTVLQAKHRLCLEYMKWYSHTTYFQKTCFHSSSGIDVEKMVFDEQQWLQHELFLPGLAEQRRILGVLSTWEKGLRQVTGVATAKRHLKVGLLQRFFSHSMHGNGFPTGNHEVVPISSVAEVNKHALSGNTPPNYCFTYIDLGSVAEGRIVLPEAPVTFGEAPSRARRIVKSNDILLATVRPYLRGFALVPANIQDWIASTGFAVITAKYPADAAYLYQSLYSEPLLTQMSACLTGSNFPALNASDVEGLRIPWPRQAHDRHRIGLILTRLDDEIRLLDSLADRISRQMQALIQELLTGEVRVPLNQEV